jgi:hypothetical protein
MLAVATILSATPLAAQTPLASLYDKYQFDLSGTTLVLNSKVRIDTDGRPGTEVDAEDDLGLPTTRLQPRGSFRWRPGRTHELEAGYQFVRREGEKMLERTIDFGDDTFEVGRQVASELDADQLFFTYRWAFVAKERSQYGVGAAFGILYVDIGIDGTASIDTSEVEASPSKSLNAPVGSLGLYGRWLACDRWFFQADLRYIQASVSRFDAKVFEGGGAARYFFERWIGVEAGYAFSAIDLDVGPRTRRTGEEGLFSGIVKYSLHNARLGVVFVPWS